MPERPESGNDQNAKTSDSHPNLCWIRIQHGLWILIWTRRTDPDQIRQAKSNKKTKIKNFHVLNSTVLNILVDPDPAYQNQNGSGSTTMKKNSLPPTCLRQGPRRATPSRRRRESERGGSPGGPGSGWNPSCMDERMNYKDTEPYMSAFL
jgi:hypothetical protein